MWLGSSYNNYNDAKTKTEVASSPKSLRTPAMCYVKISEVDLHGPLQKWWGSDIWHITSAHNVYVPKKPITQ